MASSRGHILYDMLVDINYPEVNKLSADGLDWIYENDEALPFLDWMSKHVSKENVVAVNDLEDFSQLSAQHPAKILEENLLEAAMQCAGLGEQQESCDELQRQIDDLEAELSLQDACLDRLQQVKVVLGDAAGREAARAGQVGVLRERAEREERRRQEQVIAINGVYNAEMVEVGAAVEEMMETYGRATLDHANPTFVSEIDLAKLEAADATLEEELGLFIAKQFGKDFKKEVAEDGSVVEGVIGDPVVALTDPVCLELVKGRDEEEFSRLTSEIGRLRVCFYDAELQKLAAVAAEAGASAALVAVEKHLAKVEQGVAATGFIAKPVLVVNGEEEVVEEAGELIAKLSNCHCQHILTADYQLKARRNEYVLDRQGGIVEVMLGQRARQEIVATLLDMEKGQFGELVEVMRRLKEELSLEVRMAEGEKAALGELAQYHQSMQRNLIAASDPVMVRAHKVLVNGGAMGHLACYKGVMEAVERMKEQVSKMEAEMRKEKREQEDTTRFMEKNVKKLLKSLHLETTSQIKNLSLAPVNVSRTMESLQKEIRSLEQKLKTSLQAWEKNKTEMKTLPHLSLQRNVWVDFVIRPQLLSANVRAFVNKVKD